MQSHSAPAPVSHHDLQKFTNILLRKMVRSSTDADFMKMKPEDYRLALDYYEQLTGKRLIKTEGKYVTVFGEGSWMTVLNDLDTSSYDVIRDIVANNGADVRNIPDNDKKISKDVMDKAKRLFP